MLDNFYIYSDFSMRCIRQTTRGCRPYRLALSGCRFGRSGSSGFVGGFRRRPVRGGSGYRCSRSNRSYRGRF